MGPGASFRHVLLTEDRDRSVARFEARSNADDRTEKHAAAATASGGRQGPLELYDAVHTVVAVRQGVLVVRSVDGDVDGTFRRRLAQVLAPPDPWTRTLDRITLRWCAGAT